MEMKEAMFKHRVRQVDIRKTWIKDWPDEKPIHHTRLCQVVNGLDKFTELQKRRIKRILQSFDVPNAVIKTIKELQPLKLKTK